MKLKEEENNYVLYHNSKCSKSRTCLKMIQEKKITCKEFHYLKEGLTLSNLNEIELNKKLSQSKIFLSFSNLEGIGMPPIEAALAENIVIGYIGGGGSEYWKKPMFHKVEHGEIKNFGDLIIKFIKNYNKSWITKTKNARSKLSNQYSVKKEITSIKFLEKKIRKLFN